MTMANFPMSEESKQALRDRLAMAREAKSANMRERLAAATASVADPEMKTEPEPEPIVSAYEQSPAAPGVDYDSALGGMTGNAEFARILGQAVAAGISNSMPSQPAFGPKPIPPALQKKRNEAHERMIQLLESLQEQGNTPRYEIVTPAPGGFFIDDVLIPTGEIIDYFGEPNEGMRPLNRPGEQVMALFLESIGGGTPDLADISYNAYLNRPRHAQVVGAPQAPPPLGTPRTLQNATVAVVEPAERRYVGPAKVLGTVQPEIPGRF